MIGRMLKSRRALFVLPTAVNGIITLAAVPVLIKTVGATAWSEIAVGQAVGGFVLVVISFGWGITGPAMIGGVPLEERPYQLSLSNVARLVIGIPCLACGVLVCLSLNGGATPAAVLSCIGMGAIGLNAVWYFVGVSSPISLLVYDTVPKVTFVIAGLVCVIAGGSAWMFAMLQIIGVISGFIISWVAVCRGTVLQHLSAMTFRREILDAIIEQRHGLATVSVGALFTSVPLPIVSALAPKAVVTFAVIDKIQKQLATATVPFGNMIVSESAELASGAPANATIAARHGVRMTFWVSGICMAAVFVSSWPLMAWISAGRAHSSIAISVAIAVSVAAAFAMRTLPAAAHAGLGMLRTASASTVGGVVVGIPLIAFGAAQWGAVGALSAVALSSVGVLIAQAFPLFTRTSDSLKGIRSASGGGEAQKVDA